MAAPVGLTGTVTALVLLFFQTDRVWGFSFCMDYDSNPRPAHPAPSSRRAALQTLSKVAAGTALWGAIEIPAASAEQPALWADLDGDLGIIWGGRNRCAPEDSSCRDDGQREEEVAVAPPPAIDAFQITDRCALDVAVSGQPAGTIVIGLWGRAAPELVGTFAALCRNDLVVPGGELFGYDDSQIDQVSKGRAVSFGRVKVPAGMFRRAAKAQPEDFAPPPSDDRTPQRHDRPGLVSVPRGGASFRFLVTAGQAAAVNGGGGGGGGGLFGGPWRGLDDENVVVGQVLEGMDVLARLDRMPLNKYSGAPLRKVIVSAARVLR